MKEFFLTLIILLSFMPAVKFAQELENKKVNRKLKIMIECSDCDIDYIRREIKYVDFMRDRKDADVHIITSDLNTGSGGEQYTITFSGQNEFTGLNDTLKYNTLNTDTEDEERNKMVNMLKLGLIRYILRTPAANNINIEYIESGMDSISTEDDWDYWVFRTHFDSWFSGERSSNSLELYGSFTANRITDEWKISLSVSSDYDESNFDVDDLKIKTVSRSQYFSGSLVKSIDDHWSIGAWAQVRSSTYNNFDLSTSLSPGIEFNFFPYSESTRKQLRLQYIFTPQYNNYTKETIYFKKEEFLFRESLEFILELIQPWGTIEAYLEGSHYLHDFNRNIINLHTDFELNLLKGFTLDLSLGVSRIHDQISLPRGTVTVEEVLLHRRELETQYSYWGSFGFSYYFGSIYNNIVNPRFGD